MQCGSNWLLCYIQKQNYWTYTEKGVCTSKCTAAERLTWLAIVLFLQVIKVYNEDNTSRLIEVQSDITAQDVCQLFVLKNQCIDDHNWTLFEHLSHLGIGKTFVSFNNTK